MITPSMMAEAQRVTRRDIAELEKRLDEAPPVEEPPLVLVGEITDEGLKQLEVLHYHLEIAADCYSAPEADLSPGDAESKRVLTRKLRATKRLIWLELRATFTQLEEGPKPEKFCITQKWQLYIRPARERRVGMMG